MSLPPTTGLVLTPAPSATLKFHFPTATQSTDGPDSPDAPAHSSAAAARAAPAHTATRHMNDLAYMEIMEGPE